MHMLFFSRLLFPDVGEPVVWSKIIWWGIVSTLVIYAIGDLFDQVKVKKWEHIGWSLVEHRDGRTGGKDMRNSEL